MAHPLIAATERATRELRLAGAAEREREVELARLERYALDPLALLSDGLVYIWSKEERRPVVFEPFDSQVESLLAWIDVDFLRANGRPRFRNVLEEKTRQVGASWIYCYGMLWAVSFHSIGGLAVHLNAAEVDDGGPRNTRDSLFGKVRYMHRRLPRDVAAPLRFRPGSREPAKIENTEREATVYGEVASPNPGRGGAYDFVLGDEMAFITWGESAHSALDEACPEGKAYISTVAGNDNVHARLIDERPQGWIVLRHHWASVPLYNEGAHIAGAETETCELCKGNDAGLPWDPHEPLAHRYPGRLTSPWYDRRVIGKTDEQVARELDIDRTRALPARVFTEWERDRHVADEPIFYDDVIPLELGADYGVDWTAIAICQDHPSEYRVLDAIRLAEKTPEVIAALLRERLAELGWREDMLTPTYTRRIYGRGDPSGDSKEVASHTSTTDAYRRQGFNFLPPPRHLAGYGRPVGPSINAVKRLLLGTPKRLVVSPAAEAFIEDIEANRWPIDSRTGRRRAGATVPEDDIHNHLMRAFAYLVVSKFPPPIEDDPQDFAVPLAKGREGGVLSPGLRRGMSL